MSDQSAAGEPQTSAAPPNEELINAIYTLAAEMMHNGAPAPEIEKKLMEMGVDAEGARIVVQNLKEARSKAIQEAGKKNMLYGALWCVGGLLVTVISMQAAQGGGRYVLAWGAILFGGIQFFRGLIQSSSES